MSIFKDQGNIAYTKGEWDKSIELYSKGIQELESTQNNELNNNNNNNELSILYCNRSMANIKLQKFDQSLLDAQKSVKLNPKFSKGYLRVGDSLIGLKKYREAKEIYLECIRSISVESMSDITLSNTLLQQANFSLQNSKMKLFYEPIFDSNPEYYGKVELRYLDDVKEKALFSKVDIAKGEIVYLDDPFIHQISPNSLEKHGNLLCFNCMKFIDNPADIVKCNGPKCLNQYCSQECKNLCISQYHQGASCIGNILDSELESHPIIKYRQLVSQFGSTTTTFLLVESLVSKISQSLKSKQSKNCNLALGSITHLKRSSLLALQPSFNGKNLQDLQQQYKPLLQLLEQAYGSIPDELKSDKILTQELNKLFSLQFFDDLLGMINYNSTKTFVKQQQKVEQSKTKQKSNNNTTNNISSWGMGLYPIFSCMNHSCSPNIELCTEPKDGVNSNRVKENQF
eukprot:gene6242-7773_t